MQAIQRSENDSDVVRYAPEQTFLIIRLIRESQEFFFQAEVSFAGFR
jgi:hypothetical protein